MAQYLLVAVWSLGHMRLLWVFGVESRQTSVVLPCLQSCFEDLRALTGGSRPPILRLHSDKASEFLLLQYAHNLLNKECVKLSIQVMIHRPTVWLRGGLAS